MDGGQGPPTMWPMVDMQGVCGPRIFRDAGSLNDERRRLFRVGLASGVGVDVMGRRRFTSSRERIPRLARATDARSRNGGGRFNDGVEMRR